MRNSFYTFIGTAFYNILFMFYWFYCLHGWRPKLGLIYFCYHVISIAYNAWSLNIFVKSSIIDVWQSSEYACAYSPFLFAFLHVVETSSKDEKKEDIPLLYQNLGCYRDDPESHDLRKSLELPQLTQENCVKACALDDKKFSYFGLQNGTSCYCGRSYGKYGKLEGGECSAKCDGNNEQNCGGINANSVYFYGLGKSY